MKRERIVAGVRCGEVLQDLGRFRDGELDEGRTRQLSAHVAECDICERFGGEYATAVNALRALGEAPPLDKALAERLRKSIEGV